MFSLDHWPYVSAQKQPGGGRLTPSGAVPAEPASAGSASRACCCPALAQVIVLIPAPTVAHPDRRVEILLCSHHYRVSAARLADIGAVATRADGGRPLLLEPSPASRV
jgi:hypothetical protein